jgi:hypothetical protein
MTRARKEDEIGRGRGGMVSSDFLKYVIPAMLAGGTIGSLKG